MEATMLDLRKNTKQLIKAIDDHETVTLTYRGKKKAVILPYNDVEQRPTVVEHAAFGMWKDRTDLDDVSAFVRNMRRGRQP